MYCTGMLPHAPEHASDKDQQWNTDNQDHDEKDDDDGVAGLAR